MFSQIGGGASAAASPPAAGAVGAPAAADGAPCPRAGSAPPPGSGPSGVPAAGGATCPRAGPAAPPGSGPSGAPAPGAASPGGATPSDARSSAVTSEYGVTRSPRRISLARYVRMGCSPRSPPAVAARAAATTSSFSSPAVDSTARAPGPGSARTRRPRSPSCVVARRAASMPATAGAPDPTPASSSVLASRPSSRSRCMRSRLTNTARENPCWGRNENSPRSAGASTSRMLSRIVLPRSSRRPCSELTGMAEGFWTRTSSVSSAAAPSSRARPPLTSTSPGSGPRPPPGAAPSSLPSGPLPSPPSGPPSGRLKAQNRSSTP